MTKHAARKRWWARALGAAAAGAAAYAVLIEPAWLERTFSRIHIRRLPAELEGLRIALLTDLHLGGTTTAGLVERAAGLCMAMWPDLIALTGDFAADEAPGFLAVLRALSGLRAPLGVYAVPGNHDYAVGIGEWHREMAAHPVITDLTNAAVLRSVGDARLCIAGVDDLAEGKPRLDALPPPDERDLTVLLAHDPAQAERSRRSHDRIDLILSGHLHGGQVRLPWFGALAKPTNYRELPDRIGDIYDEGLRRRPWTQVYTSRGIGTVGLPVRFLARPEVAILDLTSSPRPPVRRKAAAGRVARSSELRLAAETFFAGSRP